MATRKKSLLDIELQAERLIETARNRGDEKRIKQVRTIADDYLGNVAESIKKRVGNNSFMRMINTEKKFNRFYNTKRSQNSYRSGGVS